MAAPIAGTEPHLRRIIVCCDGTAGTAYGKMEKSPLTNVSRIARCIPPFTTHGTSQVVLYLTGIGTESASGVVQNWWNQGIGTGIDEKIIEAYHFICQNYSNEQDEIILIGFSRGAFTVRCIADLISKIGLLTRRGLFYLRPVYDWWSSGGEYPDPSAGTEPDDQWPSAVQEAMQYRQPKAGIKACGLWDTVAALGTSPLGFLWPRRPRWLYFVHSTLPTGIDYVFQALALHEHRQPMLPVVCIRDPKNPVELRQCWFVGFHGDIGGGNKCEGIERLVLIWMTRQLAEFVEFDDSLLEKRDPGHVGLDNIVMQDPMTSLWRPLGSFPRQPCQQFWDGGFILRTPQNLSGEHLHATVRHLVGRVGLPPCPLLHAATNDWEPGRKEVSWNLPFDLHNWWSRPFWRVGTLSGTQAPGIRTYPVPEMISHPEEKSLLGRWLNPVHADILDQANVDDPEPQTIIAGLKNWIGESYAVTQN